VPKQGHRLKSSGAFRRDHDAVADVDVFVDDGALDDRFLFAISRAIWRK
jgi:hypothetical protein